MDSNNGTINKQNVTNPENQDGRAELDCNQVSGIKLTQTEYLKQQIVDGSNDDENDYYRNRFSHGT